jgi:ATP-dependent DNA helicase RecG
MKRGQWKDKLTTNQLKIMDLIAADDRTSVTKLSAAVGISATAIENNLAKLKELGVLDREGDARTGQWKIL